MGAQANGKLLLSKRRVPSSNLGVPAMKISKPKFLLGIPIALMSLELFFGVFLGYLLPKLFGRKVPSVLFNIGGWKLHFHHWFIGFGILISSIYYNFLPFPQFSYGFLGGLIFQGITCYPDWHKIIMRRSLNTSNQSLP